MLVVNWNTFSIDNYFHFPSKEDQSLKLLELTLAVPRINQDNRFKVLSQRKMELLLLVLVFVCSSLVQSEQDVVPSIPVSVSRRPSSDVYYYKNDSTLGTFCDNENFINVTYLVSETRCVTNEDLLTCK